MEQDSVNHPAHYTSSNVKCPGCERDIECIDVTRSLDFNLGNAIKYIWRAPYKGNAVEDLKKAIWYIEDYIKNK
jgi:hypothetical protein